MSEFRFARVDAEGRLLLSHIFMPGGVATMCGLFVPADAKLPEKGAARCMVCVEATSENHPSRRLR